VKDTEVDRSLPCLIPSVSLNAVLWRLVSC